MEKKEEKNNRKGKGGKYLEKENIFAGGDEKWRRKKRKTRQSKLCGF